MDKEAQEDELLALASIYEENVFSSESENGISCGQFRAFLSLTQPFHIISKSKTDAQSSEKHVVEHLPPITLHFQLPLDYPSVSPPKFTLSCKWLNREQVTQLCQKLDNIWQDNALEVVLFQWINFLSTESLNYLHIDDHLDLLAVCPPKAKPIAQPKIGISESNGNESTRLQNKSDLSNADASQSCSFRETKDGNISSASHKSHLNQNARPKKFSQHHHYYSNRKTHRRTNDACDSKAEGSSERKPRPHRPCGRGRGRAVRDKHPELQQEHVIEANSSNGDCRAIQEIRCHEQLLRVLLEYDQLRRQQEFDKQFFVCNVCFEEKFGSQCLALKPCNHVFCKECLKSYFSIQIQSGCVQNLTCPEEKCSSQALPTQVRDLVDPELYAKYDRLLLSTTLDTMADITYCPRMNCQCPILIETGSNMASCPSCFHVFCIFCKLAYHGIVPCRLRPDERLKIVDEYMNADSMDKRLMEKRYGQKQLKQLIDNTLSEEWVYSNSKPCPKCKANIEKLDGCNKMTCWKCDNYFCWLCMMCLSKGNPYDHYNNTASSCQGLLFQGAELDDSDDDFEDEFGQFLD